MSATVRGIRNNNPFNIRRSAKDKWQGLAQVQSDLEFCVFDTAIMGIRAGMRNLIAAQDKHGRHTIRAIMSAYAPPSENATGAYIRAVSDHMGVQADDVVDMHQYADLRGISEAIIGHENGGEWSQWYTDAQMVKACVMAGVEPPKKSLVVSKQMIGGTIAASATVAAPIVQTVQDQLAPLTDYSVWIKKAFLAAALLGIVLAMWAKYNERKKGIS